MVLPPRLPGSRPKETRELDRALTERLQKACDFISQHLLTGEKAWQSLSKSLEDCYVLNYGGLDQTDLVESFGKIGDKTLALHVVEQNAGLLIRQE